AFTRRPPGIRGPAGRDNRRASPASLFQLVKGTLARLLVQVLLELAGLVREEAEGVVDRQPLDVRRVLPQVLAHPVQLGQDLLGFHGLLPADCTRLTSRAAIHSRDRAATMHAPGGRRPASKLATSPPSTPTIPVPMARASTRRLRSLRQ